MEKIKSNILDALYYLEQNSTFSLTSIGEKFGTSRHTLSKWKNQNYKKFIYYSEEEQEYYYFTDEECQALNDYEYYLNSNYTSLRKKYPSLPIRQEAYCKWLKIYNSTNIQYQKRKFYTYDRNSFSKIEKEEDAYWLGFILADGCIINEDRLSINLAEKDKGHLEKFCKYLKMPETEIKQIIKSGFGGSYNKDNPIVMLNICSVQIVNNLKNKNIFANKSGKEIPYKCANIELEKAYIRGIIDGDGYIRETQYGFGVVGSLQICEYILNYINKNIINIQTEKRIHQHGTIYKLEVTGRKQTSKILQYFYQNANIYLDRKYKVFKTNYNN